MNFQEIVSKLNGLGINPEKLHDFHYYGNTSEEFKNIFGATELVQHYGGEGEGETYYDIIRFVDHNVYIKIDAYYSSYDGADWDSSEFKEVKPTEKTVTVYE